MEVNSAFTSAISGIQRGMEGMARNADEIAKAANGEGGSIIEPLVESRMHKLQVEASSWLLAGRDGLRRSTPPELPPLL